MVCIIGQYEIGCQAVFLQKLLKSGRSRFALSPLFNGHVQRETRGIAGQRRLDSRSQKRWSEAGIVQSGSQRRESPLASLRIPIT